MPNKVHHHDFLHNQLPDKWANLILADPPYYKTKGHFDFVWPSFEAYLADVRRWAEECRRLLADNGTIVWWGDAKKIAYSQVILDEYFNLVNAGVWRKVDGLPLKNNPEGMRSYAPITERFLVYEFGENENQHAFIAGNKRTEVMEPLVGYFIDAMQASGHTPATVNKALGTRMASHWLARTSQWSLPTAEWYGKLQRLFVPGSLSEQYEHLKAQYEHLKAQYEHLKAQYEHIRRPFNNPPGKLQLDVLDYSQESHITREYEHDTKKPESLISDMVLTLSREGDNVLVPFAGSGTECAMAARNGRTFSGYDIEPKYVDMSQRRADKELAKLLDAMLE